jgi:hypothetical protein
MSSLDWPEKKFMGTKQLGCFIEFDICLLLIALSTKVI